MLRSWTCVVPYPDGGKSCSDDSQCKGGCIAQLNFGPVAKPGTPVRGVCEQANDGFGCTTHVKNGRALDTLCVD
jgi:hypothetical protein